MVKWNFTCIHLLHLIKQEQERYCNLSFQKTKESVLKHHLLSPSIYKIMQRRHSYSFAFTLSVKHEQEQY